MSALAGLAATFVGNAHEPQMPQFARDLGYGGDGMYYSLLLAANALGALTAGIVLEARSMMPAATRTSFILGILWAAAIFGFAVSPFYILSFALLVCAGFLDLSFNSMTRTLAQLNSPPEIRGRAIGVFNVGALGCRTFSGFTVGFGGGLMGIHVSLALSAAIMLVAMVALFAWAKRRGVLARA
jgi:MFS family permease